MSLTPSGAELLLPLTRLMLIAAMLLHSFIGCGACHRCAGGHDLPHAPGGDEQAAIRCFHATARIVSFISDACPCDGTAGVGSTLGRMQPERLSPVAGVNACVPGPTPHEHEHAGCAERCQFLLPTTSPELLNDALAGVAVERIGELAFDALFGSVHPAAVGLAIGKGATCRCALLGAWRL